MADEGTTRGLAGSTVGQYRIESLIGRGGMGEVYLASDLKLRRSVAIKVLPDRLAGDANARARFVRECRLACKVVHPYVATVFDVIEHADRPLIVMEKIDGSRLDRWIRETSPKPAELAAIGLEIAEALSAIHRAGIVHRDLKPGNVMITPEGHVKVTDFGVALPTPGLPDDLSTLAADEADVVTHTGAGVGTVAYMSPEQIRGRPLDGRSDLFSLGIVLYESVTGEHPFRRESFLGTASAIVNDLPSAGRENPTLTGSGPIRDVILRLLQKSPELRYASADAAAADLRAVVRGDRLSPRPRPPMPLKRIATAAVVVAAVAAGAWLAIRPREGDGGTGPPPRPLIAVLPFSDGTDEVDGRSRAAMMADLLGRTLSQTRRLRAVDPDRLADALGGASPLTDAGEALRRVAQNVPVEWIASGRLYREGGQWLAAVDLFRPGTPEPVESIRVEASTASALADLAAARVLGALFPDGGAADRLPRAAGLRSEDDEAQATFHAALEARREFRLADALLLLERAVSLDPAFVLARVEWASTLQSAGFQGRARTTAAAARRDAEAQKGPEKERLRLLARAVDANARDALEEEIVAWQALSDLVPDEPVVHLSLAAAQRLRGRFEDAAAALDRAERLDPSDPRIPVARARLKLAKREFVEADRTAELAVQGFRELESTVGTAIATRLRADIAFRAGRYDDSERWYTEAGSLCAKGGLGDLAKSFSIGIADCRLARGRLGEAEAGYRESIDAARRLGNLRTVVTSLGNLGGALYSAGEHEKAEAALREAVAEGRSIENPGITLGALVNLAGLLGYQGRTAESKALAEESLRIAREARDVSREALSLLFLADAEFQQGLFRKGDEHYAELVAARRKEGSPERELGVALFAHSWVLLETGRTADAMREIDEALEIHRRLGENTTVAYALVVRAGILAQWADWGPAEKDLAEARRLSATLQAPDRDLSAHIDLARARTELMRGRYTEARRLLDPLRAGAGSTLATTVVHGALAASCEALVGGGDPAAGAEAAREVLRSPKAMEIDRLRARVCLAGALQETDEKAAAAEARIVLEGPEAGAVPMLVARAACTAAGSSGGATEAASLRKRGLTALEAYLDAAPDDRKPAIRSRFDVRNLIASLETGGH